MFVKDNLNIIEQKIAQATVRSNRKDADVTVIGVTKYVTSMRALEAVQAGVVHLGENYAEGLLQKQAELACLQEKTSENTNIYWHFIGSLQSRKVKKIINQIDFLHSLDRDSLAQEIQKHRIEPLDCFVQVNISKEETKHGIYQENVVSWVQNLAKYDKIRVIGLMTMAPLTDNEAEIRHCFSLLRELASFIIQLNLPFAPCQHLSMGMSSDYEIAIEEGATMVRIGSALVGE